MNLLAMPFFEKPIYAVTLPRALNLFPFLT